MWQKKREKVAEGGQTNDTQTQGYTDEAGGGGCVRTRGCPHLYVCVLVFCMHLYLSSVMEYFCLDSYIA